jgi:two-component system sensor histidine kinase FlrB
MDAQPNTVAPHLEDAFDAFIQVSGRLIEAYRELETRVAGLQEELARTRSERMQELAEKERLATRLGLLLESLPAGVVVLDGQGVVREANPEARVLLGEELQGALWRGVVQGLFAPRPDDGADVSLRNGRRVNIATCSLGREPGQILLIHDVTEPRRLQDQLSQLRRLSATGEMAASLAHQIRTPLASGLLYTGSLARRSLDTEARLKMAGKLRQVLVDLERLVEDMLAFTRTGNFEVEAITAEELCRALCRALDAGENGRPILHEACNQAGDAVIQGSREALVSVFQNLFRNALEAGGDGVRVTLRMGLTERDQVRITVTDDGPGIPSEVQSRIFEPFFTTRSGGTGLGLAVVQAVVRSHGGTVSVTSEPGEGSRFTVELPVRVLEDRGERAIATVPRKARPSAGRAG